MAGSSATPGGQPSTMAPIAAPWLSPQVVTRNRWPKLLSGMGVLRVSGAGCGAAGAVRSGKPDHSLRLILAHSALLVK